MKNVVGEIERIKEILPLLSETALFELSTFTDYLADRERRRKELVDRVLKAEREPDTITCHSVEEFIQAIENAADED